jgi:uncharacterized protein YbjT (DUF2867 family)
MSRVVAVSGASGKTGYRIAEELLVAGVQPRLLLRPESVVPPSLSDCEQVRLNLGNDRALDQALLGVEALIIATGARPSFDLSGPMRVDAWGVKRQIASCQRVNVNRLVLVSSLCAGRWLHPLNLFGLILLWKRVGEQALERSGLNWTVVRPGGLSEREFGLEDESIRLTGPDQQDRNSSPRRLVAQFCVEALETPGSIGRLLEITSDENAPRVALADALALETL